ncbi:CIC11C00000005617 [Sungouiella intermedia]|uniref:Phosphatidylethanolamine N-methyltransferase n=1 Tax=Sungouiella intermedia TaxID=45354 RepID=A0A1L0DT76_9ASCO|nr:CIC11C00000005617 [[Candida] intermedia]
MASERKGVTFNGETFSVPETHDMVKTLFDPTVHKSICETVIIILLIANSLVFYFVSDNSTRIQIFVAMYVFWRLSYNFGIGFLLNQQSNKFRLVEISKKLGLFSKQPTSVLANFAQTEVKSQMGSNYNIYEHPIDFNTWLIFRKVVDLILMQDFTTFVCLFVACAIDNDNQFLRGQPSWLTALRMITGITFIVFNFWVKVNAHNTIKDYAWYWGDFFFRQINNEDLIFDGVFEMFPHPMYSVGYIGYYGFALIAKSYTVLIVAVFGHFLQMVFLHFIENPHIDKIYGPSADETSLAQLFKLKDLSNFENAKPLVGFVNFNVLRASDVMNLVNCVTYAVVIPLFASFSVTNVGAVGKVLFYLTVVIKSLECLSINAVLIMQSYYKTFTKWYLANNMPVEKALNNFAILFNSVINLSYAAFIGMNFFKLLTLMKYQDLLLTDYLYLRLFLGVLLVLTQIWINVSIIDLIGYFGWFYGDFFIPKSSFMPQRTHLTKAGVYRYLNNPEQVFGVCGIMGVTLMLPTFDNIVICVLWVMNNFFRINFVEKNHMIKIYGEQEVLQDSGVTKTVKKHLLPGSIQKRFDSQDSPKKRRTSSMFMDSFDSFVKELRSSGNFSSGNSVSKETLVELSQNKHFTGTEYNLSISGLKQGEEPIPFAYVGDDLEVSFSAPVGHSAKDWIGLYKITHTSYSRYRTLISSNNRWDWTGPEETGRVHFSHERLFWEEGLYEFRYHLDGKHDVTFISEPFELKYHIINVPLNALKAKELADSLRTNIFDHVVGGISDNTTPIYNGISKSNNVVETYTRIARLISKSTGINVNKRFLIYNDNESRNTFTIQLLADKLIHIKSALNELVEEEDLQEKKLQ